MRADVSNHGQRTRAHCGIVVAKKIAQYLEKK
jgi:hypothetical protein